MKLLVLVLRVSCSINELHCTKKTSLQIISARVWNNNFAGSNDKHLHCRGIVQSCALKLTKRYSVYSNTIKLCTFSDTHKSYRRQTIDPLCLISDQWRSNCSSLFKIRKLDLPDTPSRTAGNWLKFTQLN